MEVSPNDIPYPNPLACAHILTNSKWKSDASNAASMCNTASECREHNLWVHNFQSQVHPCTMPESDKDSQRMLSLYFCALHTMILTIRNPATHQTQISMECATGENMSRRCFVVASSLLKENNALCKRTTSLCERDTMRLLKKTIRFGRIPMHVAYENIAVCHRT